ncbi:MAG: RNA polymerase sigma factor [Mariniblastus sp.]
MAPSTRLSLIDEVKRGESPEAWEQFSEIYDSLIAHWLRREGIQAADVADVSQEVLTAVFTQVQKFEHNGNVGAFRCWLRRITANRLRRVWSKKSRQQQHGSEVNLADLADQISDDRSRMSRVWDEEHNTFLINKLLDSIRQKFNAKHLAAFRRVSLEGEDAQAVADEFSMSLGAVRVAQHRILKTLKQIAGSMLE